MLDLAEQYFIEGNDFYKLGWHPEAVDSYDKAIAIKPDYAFAWVNRGNALFKLGRDDDALTSWANAWFNHGNALFKLGQYTEAIASCDKAIAIKPDYLVALFTRGFAQGGLEFRDDEKLMKIIDFIRANSVEQLNTQELIEEEMRLQKHVEFARKEIIKIEKQKKDIFKQGVGADLIQKKTLAQKLKQLDMQAQLKFRDFMTIDKQYRFISNIVVIKQYGKELKQNEYEKPNALFNIHITPGRIKTPSKICEMSLSELEQSTEETQKQILDSWNGVETGAIDVEEAKKQVQWKNN